MWRIILELDKKKTPFSIFLDLSKAFDTVNHDILLDKLAYYGVSGMANNLLKSYLGNRKQYIDLDGSESSCLDIMTGVPQGSVLGPLLFLIYINDISVSSDKFNFILFADDTSLFGFITMKQEKSHYRILIFTPPCSSQWTLIIRCLYPPHEFLTHLQKMMEYY